MTTLVEVDDVHDDTIDHDDTDGEIDDEQDDGDAMKTSNMRALFKLQSTTSTTSSKVSKMKETIAYAFNWIDSAYNVIFANSGVCGRLFCYSECKIR